MVKTRREFYRGFGVNKKDWVYGYYYCDIAPDGKLKHIIRPYLYKGENSGIDFEVFPESIGRGSGVNDTSGREIFEGDVISVKSKNHLIMSGRVIFSNGSFGVSVNYKDEDLFYAFPCLENMDYTIIGNGVE